MKLFQTILGLVLVLAAMSSFASAGSLEHYEEADDSLIGDSESDEFAANANVQQDYLNVGDYVRPPPPWWF